MNAAISQPAATVSPERVEHPRARIESVDIFRGLTLLVMVFVNDVSDVKGLPWWTHHMPTQANGMTYVDMVFPTFLFIVGLSIPLAVERRIRKGDSKLQLWGHMLLRTLALLTLGLILANEDRVSAPLTGINATTWRLLAFAGIILLWNVYPRLEHYRWLFRALRAVGFGLLAWLLINFRRETQTGAAAGLDFRYWEILGLIGFAYFSACIFYLLLRAKPWALVGCLAAFIALNVLCTARWLQWPSHLPDYVWPFGNGAHASIVMAGVVGSLILLGRHFAQPLRTRVKTMVGYALVLLALGTIFLPLEISKNRATPSWSLYCSAVAALLFLLLYWIADLHGHTRWAAFVKPAGSNTLLTYLLPFLWSAIPPLDRLSGHWEAGTPGVIRAFCFTGLILAMAGILSRLKLRLQL